MKMMMLIFSMIIFFNIFTWWELTSLMIFSFYLMFSFSHMFSYYSSLSYFLGYDMISILMILLSIWIILLMYLSSFSIFNMNNYMKEFIMICLLLLFFLYLSFSCTNLFLFYIFFESSLIPTLFLILGWGYQPERLSAGYYLLFYTMFASLPMLLGIFYVYNFSNTLEFYLIQIDLEFYIYLSLTLAFLIKMPIFMIHFWLPKAHVEAPVSGSMILAGVLLKLGGYGLIRVLPFFFGFNLYNDFWIILSLLGMFMVGLICLCQVDMKSLIAYSSVGHMGIVICGIMTMNYWGILGSLILMIGHGLCSSGLFSLVNMVYERTGSRSFFVNKGLISFMPNLSMFWFLFSINNMASPPSLNLIGEIVLINSIMGWCTLSFLFLSFSSFFSCCYSIYLYSISQHGQFYSGLNILNSGSVREYYLLILHWLPLNFLFLKCDYLMMMV